MIFQTQQRLEVRARLKLKLRQKFTTSMNNIQNRMIGESQYIADGFQHKSMMDDHESPRAL